VIRIFLETDGIVLKKYQETASDYSEDFFHSSSI
jgi:hypothetical protein